MQEEITTKEHIEKLVDVFYGKIMKDDVLSPLFKFLDFEKHIPKMVHFWSFVLLDEAGYTTNVTEKHLKMPLKGEHFDRWISLFEETIDELFQGEKAEQAKQRAVLVGWTIKHKMENQ